MQVESGETPMNPGGEELWGLPAGRHRAAAVTDTSSISSPAVEGSTGTRSPEERSAQRGTARHGSHLEAACRGDDAPSECRSRGWRSQKQSSHAGKPGKCQRDLI